MSDSGTPPTFWRFIEREPVETLSQRLRETAREWRDAGFRHMRATEILPGSNPAEGPAGIWLEGWETRPEKEAPFNPPLTLAEPTP